MSSRAGRLFVVAAPSGAGKTSLVGALVAADPSLVISISYTTRPQRPGEENGRHYHFTSVCEFERMLKEEAFLEHARVYGHYYGTHRDTTQGLLDDSKDVILEIDWQGARQVRESYPDCHSIFILPPSLETLYQRLGRRGQDSESVISDRMRKARDEISHCPEFDTVVINDDFDTALTDLQTTIRCARQGRPAPQATYEELLAELLGKR